MSQCPSHTRCCQLHKFVCYQSPSSSHPSLCSSLVCHGLICDCPFSKDTPHPPLPLGSLWCVRNTQAGVPGRACHPPSIPVSIGDWAVLPSQPFEQQGRAGCLPPVFSADSPERHSFRVTLYSASTG